MIYLLIIYIFSNMGDNSITNRENRIAVLPREFGLFEMIQMYPR